MSKGKSNLARHNEVLTHLAKSEAMSAGDLGASLGAITEAAAKTLNIARVNIWLYDEARTKITCIDHYDLQTREHSSGVEIEAVDYPNYFKALEEERTLVANDAVNDPKTAEFAHGYLDELGITSMMDAPLRVQGRVIGIVCHEHIGPPRVWSVEEQQFAGSLADLAALALEAAKIREAEQALDLSEMRTRAILANALGAIVTVDENSVIVDWNPRAEATFGWTREEALGMTLYETILPERDHEQHRKGVQHFLETGHGPMLNRRIEVTAVDKDGREFPTELSVSPLRLGDSYVFSAFIRDISDRVRAQREIQELNANLERRVLERTEQLKTVVDQKEQLLDQLRASSAALQEKLREVEHKSKIIRKDLKRAQVIQRALLPSQPPQLKRVHVDALYRPGMNVGGDLYDVERLPDGKVVLYVADAMGHGVSAAMLSVLFKQRLQPCDSGGCAINPADVLTHVNQELFGDVLSPGMFLTAAYVVFDPETYELRAASAGHTPIVLLREDGEILLLDRTGPGLGIDKDPRYTEHRLTLRPNDRLVLYTDGLIDGIEARGTEGLQELITAGLNADSLDGPSKLRRLYDEAAERARANNNGDGADDVTLLVLEVCSGPSHLDNDPKESRRRQKRATPAPQAPSRAGELWTAESPKETYIACRGRVTWTIADGFRNIAHTALAAGRNLRIDLTPCTCLDSTFLGTLHEIVARGGKDRVHIHGPNPVVRGLFAELGLHGVLAAVDPAPAEPPPNQTLVPKEVPTRASQLLLLKAHEALSDLSAENRDRFAGLLESLRVELGANG